MSMAGLTTAIKATFEISGQNYGGFSGNVDRVCRSVCLIAIDEVGRSAKRSAMAMLTV